MKTLMYSEYCSSLVQSKLNIVCSGCKYILLPMNSSTQQTFSFKIQHSVQAHRYND